VPLEVFDTELEHLRRLGINKGARTGRVELLPDPEPRERHYTIVSVDDHVVEPAHVFVDRLPSAYRDRAPRIIEDDDGQQFWEFQGTRYANIGLSAVVGRKPEDYDNEPARFDEMRPGCYDPKARVGDMDINGVAASLNFPSFIAGFAGLKFAKTSDPGLGLACVRAWNDWILEEWYEAYPTRFIPAQIPYLGDVQIAADEVRKNAARGFRAVSMCELPEVAGLPSLHTGYWDPLMAACQETDTVVCLHLGSSATTHRSSSDAPAESLAALFLINAQLSCVDWLSSMIPVRFPNLKIVMSEGGIGWVPALMDRLDRNFYHLPYLKTWASYGSAANLLPSEVLKRNFWFCAIEEPLGFKMLDLIGAENVFVESDYPHSDSSWPDTQEVIHKQIGWLDPQERESVTWKNACRLFRFDLG
jgi:predicted TIM-barrel fold metal-dependent hydrolase